MRRIASAFVAVGVGLATLYMPISPGRASTGRLFEEIGELERFPADARALFGAQMVPEYKALQTAPGGFLGLQKNGTLIIVPERRQLWQIWQAMSGGVTAVAVVRDLDTLKIVHSLTLPLGVRRDTTDSERGGSWSHVVDDKGTRLWLISDNARALTEINLETFATVDRPLLASMLGVHETTNSLTGGILSLLPGGMTYDPYRDDVLILYGGPANSSVGNPNTVLYTLDVSVAPPARFDPTQMYYMRSCNGPLSSTDQTPNATYGWEILVLKDELYVPCHRAGNAGAVVKMARPAAGAASNAQAEEIAIGPVYGETVMADPASGRLFMTTVEREIWVFEAKTMSFIGIIGTGPEATQFSTGYGLDRKTGRVFFQSQSFGLGVAEGRFFPIPQARTMAQKPAALGRERILVDTGTRRIFVLQGSGSAKAPAYKIYRTDVAPVPPPPHDPDRNTVDMPVREGVTEGRYFGSGSGYGFRALLAKGLSTVPPAPAAGLVAPTAKAIDENFNSNCGYTDRELVAGRVSKAEYDTGSTAASAIALDVDRSTKQDLNKPSRCDLRLRGSVGTNHFERQSLLFDTAPALHGATEAPADDPNTEPNEEKPRWVWGPGTCSSSEGVPSDNENSEGEQADFGPSKVQCPSPGQRLDASATTRLIGPLAVGEASTKTTIQLVDGFLRAEVESVARDVVIAGGAIKFAEIKAVAVSKANGRPQKDPMSQHTVTIRGLQVNGQSVCAQCEVNQALVDTLNLAANGKAIFRIGTGPKTGRDDALLEGSPRGALTAVQKSAARQASDRALVGDFTTEVPALEVTVFNDNTEWGRARQVYQFAGVASAATYNIVLRPTGLPLDPSADIQDDFVGDADGTPFDGLIEAVGSEGLGLGTETVSVDGDGEAGLIPGIARALRALGRGIRLFFTNPRHSLLLLTAWALLSLPAVLSRRRRLLTASRG